MTASSAPAGGPRNPRDGRARTRHLRDVARAQHFPSFRHALAFAAGFVAACVVSAACVVNATSVLAATPTANGVHARAESASEASRARALAAGCTTCHQPGVAGLPALAGQSREALRTRLEGYRDGSLPGTVMPQLVRGYTPAELDLVAQWFAAGRTPR